MAPSLAEKINRFVIRIVPQINQLVSDPESFTTRLWVPAAQFQGLDPQVQHFLDGLKVPASIGNPHKPNLLFHDLGSLESRALAHSLKSIFTSTSHMLLINVSGSGKTRIVLEGLLRNWGLYFVCQDDGTRIGSRDLATALTDVPNDPEFTKDLRNIGLVSGSEVLETLLEKNREIAAVKFSEVLLARLVIFNQFLQSIEEHMRQQNQHDPSPFLRKWLHLQLYPGTLHPDYEDVFVSLANSISGSTVRAMEREITRVRKSIRQKLTRQTGRSHFYIVIDEAQKAASSCTEAFMSAKNITFRPILREVVFKWTDLLNSQTEDLHMSFVVTGTGVHVRDLTEAVGSASYKHASHVFLKSSATGAFDSREDQEDYVARYVPAVVLNTDLGKKLLDRMWYWLRGRYRLTASFLTSLIENCYYKPHQLLDLFILRTAEFEPFDYDRTSFTESMFPLSCPVEHVMSAPVPDFEELEKPDNGDFRTLVLRTVYEYTLKSTVTRLLGTDGASLLQFGFARIPSFDTQVQMDERLVLLSCLKWANPHPNVGLKCPSLYHHIADSIELHNATNPENGFEHYLTFYFAKAFSEFIKLNRVFEFLDDEHPLAERRGKLVALRACTQASTGNVYYEEGITKLDPRGHVVGCASSLGRAYDSKDPKGDFERWLRFEHSEPFYFPDNSAAADIMFILKLESDGNYPPSYIWVAVQSKFHQGKPAIPDVPHNIPGYTNKSLLYLDPTTLSAAIDTTTPRRFSLYLDDNDDRLHDSEPLNPPPPSNMSQKRKDEAAERKKRRNRILAAMEELPDRASRNVAGTFSCLRIVASWPAITDLPRFVERRPSWQDPDRNDGHPLASLNRETFVALTQKLSPEDILVRYEKKKRSQLLGEVHETTIASGLQERQQQVLGDLVEQLESQVTEAGPEVDYGIEIGSQTAFESQQLYVDGSMFDVSLSTAQGQDAVGSTAMQIDSGTPQVQTAAPQPSPSSKRQSRSNTTKSVAVVRAETKVRATQPAKATPKDRKRTTYRLEKEKDVSETRKGKQATTASTSIPTSRKSARLASKAASQEKKEHLQDGGDDMNID